MKITNNDIIYARYGYELALETLKRHYSISMSDTRTIASGLKRNKCTVESFEMEMSKYFAYLRRLEAWIPGGLQSYPILRYGYRHNYDVIKVALIVLEIADELGVRNPFDGYDNHGFSLEALGRAWYNSKVGTKPTFKHFIYSHMRMIKKGTHFDYIYPKKYMSLDIYKVYIKGRVAISNSNLRDRDYIRLGSLSYEVRHYMSKQLKLVNYEYNLYTIDWDKYRDYRVMSRDERLKYMPQIHQWYKIIKRAPNGFFPITGFNPVELFKSKVAFKSFRKLHSDMMDVVYSDEDAYSIAVKLSMAFGNMRDINKFVSLYGGDYHLAANMIGYFNGIKSFGAALLRHNGKYENYILSNSSKIEAYRKRYGEFTTLKEFKERISSLRYDEGIDTDVIELASKYKLGNSAAKKYDKFFCHTSEKQFEMVPQADKIVKGKYSIEGMDAFDKEGPFLGLATDCCQHLDNAGKACAKAGYRDPESAFIVVRKDDKIIAQSWTWRDIKDCLVIDSIEGLGGISIKKVAALYKEYAKNLVGKLGIRKVYVGDSSYGITKDIKKELGISKTKKPRKMIKEVSYSDATQGVWVLAK